MKGKHYFCSLCKACCPILEQLTKNKSHQTRIVIYLSLYFFLFAYRVQVYAHFSPRTEVTVTDFHFAPPSPRCLKVPLPQEQLSRWLGLFKSPVMGLLWKWTFLSDPILCTVLLGNPRTADVSDYWNCGDDCQKNLKPWPFLELLSAKLVGGEMIYDHSLKLHKTDYRGRFQLKSSGSKPAYTIQGIWTWENK